MTKTQLEEIRAAVQAQIGQVRGNIANLEAGIKIKNEEIAGSVSLIATLTAAKDGAAGAKTVWGDNLSIVVEA